MLNLTPRDICQGSWERLVQLELDYMDSVEIDTFAFHFEAESIFSLRYICEI